MLAIRNLSKNFGGLRAVSELSFEVKQGEIVGLIGPNGAGKTTVFNLISGFLSPTEGEIFLYDHKLNNLKPHQVCKLGIGRTFQIVQPFPDISTRDNVMVGAFLHHADRSTAEKKALEALERVRLRHKQAEKAKNLTLLELKQLEIAKTLATEPKLLLLDEVAAGLNLSEIDQIMDLVRDLNQQGMTILMIEHVMKLIMGLSDRVVVLNFGRKIAEGSPEEIKSNPEVIEPISARRNKLLEVKNLSVQYGAFKALDNVSLKVPQGKVVSIVGANGAGKTTLLKTISGLLKPKTGQIFFQNHDLTSIPPHKIVHLGVVHVPEGRKLFPEMTIMDNLLCGALHPAANKERHQSLENAFELFPKLRERKNQQAKSLSGGEQQMLAIARGLMSSPTLIMLDEPSLGLAPIVVKQIFQIVRTLNSQGLTILLVEQNVYQSLMVSDYAYVLETGRIVLEGEAHELLQKESIRQAYLGV